MTMNLLDEALKGFDAQWKVPVLAALDRNAQVLCCGATQSQVSEIALEISQVSGGAGLEIVSLYMWPSDTDVPESISRMVPSVQGKMKKYNPGQEYGLT